MIASDWFNNHPSSVVLQDASLKEEYTLTFMSAMPTVPLRRNGG
jgi:hypothetical protein